MSRHQSFGDVVELLSEFTKVSRVSRPFESGSFVLLRKILRNSAEVRHSSRLKYTRHSRKCLRKSECNRQLLQIWDNERNYRLSVRKLFRPHMKDYNGSRASPCLLEEFRPWLDSLLCARQTFAQTDGMNDTFATISHSGLPISHCRPPSFIRALYEKIFTRKAHRRPRGEASRNVTPTDVRHKRVCRVWKNFQDCNFMLWQENSFLEQPHKHKF